MDKNWHEIVAQWQADRLRRNRLWDMAEHHLKQAEAARREEGHQPWGDEGSIAIMELDVRRPHWRIIRLSHLRAAKDYAIAAGVPVQDVEIPEE